jgi:hypothetical protein
MTVHCLRSRATWSRSRSRAGSNGSLAMSQIVRGHPDELRASSMTGSSTSSGTAPVASTRHVSPTQMDDECLTSGAWTVFQVGGEIRSLKAQFELGNVNDGASRRLEVSRTPHGPVSTRGHDFDIIPGQDARIQRYRSVRTRGVLFRVPPSTPKHGIR